MVWQEIVAPPEIDQYEGDESSLDASQGANAVLRVLSQILSACPSKSILWGIR